jgi:hypothetical protein
VRAAGGVGFFFARGVERRAGVEGWSRECASWRLRQ